MPVYVGRRVGLYVSMARQGTFLLLGPLPTTTRVPLDCLQVSRVHWLLDSRGGLSQLGADW